MQKDKAVYIQIIGYVLFMIGTFIFLPDASSKLWQGLKDCSVYEGNWQVETATQEEEFDTLPTFFYTENDEQDIWLSKKLENVSNGNCIGFFSFQQQVSILLDGETVYEFVPADYANSSTPGNKWNFLPINEEDSGKTVTIHIFQCYSKSRVTIPTIYYGTQAGIVMNYISLEMPRTCLSLAIILFGILIAIFCVIGRKKTDVVLNLQWLALFALFRGIWGAIEGNLYSLFISNLLLISQISYLSLKLAVVTYLQFINASLKEGKNRVLNVLTIASMMDFWGTTALQIFGICDYANTVFITHGIMLLSAFYVCVCIVHVVYGQRKDSLAILSAKRKNMYFAQLLCTMIVIVTALIDMVRYYATNSPDVARFTRIGDIIYVMTMSFALFLDFVYLIRMGHEAALIHEEASIDPMTKLRNRASFEKDMEKVSRKHSKNYSIIVCDLNNLKLFNDNHGHDAGDQYIVTASEMIRDTFSPWGNTYRIGGDEFCIIANKLTEQKFIELQMSLEKQMSGLLMPEDLLHMEVASGYACFDPSKDMKLRDTMKRADEQMYKRKLELKGEAR